MKTLLIATIVTIITILSLHTVALGDGTDPMPLCRKRECIPLK